MRNFVQRRQFLTGSMAAVALAGAGGPSRVRGQEPGKQQEHYELRIYRAPSAEKQQIVSDYLERALVPALNRMGIDRVGVFTRLDNAEDFSVRVLIPYRTLAALSERNARLAADREYHKAAASYFAQSQSDPAYGRIDSRLMKAFAGLPVLELPAQTAAKKPRIFELRTYESHNEDAARRKVEMFNSGEIQLMREVKLAPVFYGETLIAANVPNLTYMLSAGDLRSHQAHWDAFLRHPEWQRMRNLQKYKNLVSRIEKQLLKPTTYSQV